MFSLQDLRFVLFSRDLDVLHAQRILGFLFLITHKSTRSETPLRLHNIVLDIFFFCEEYPIYFLISERAADVTHNS